MKYGGLVTQNLSSNDHGNGLPSAESLTIKLAAFKGKRAFEIATEDANGVAFGNHGDVLMYEVFKSVLRQLGISLVDSPDIADFLLVRPNGALLETYQFPAILEKRLSELPDLPLIIFPSSALFPTKDPSFMFRNRKSSVLWIFREKTSFDLISSRWGEKLKETQVELFLSHDVVALGHSYVPDIIGSPLGSKHILLAGRIDGESPKGFTPKDNNASAPKPNFKLRMKKFLVGQISSRPDSPLNRILSRVIYRARLNSAADALFEALPADAQNEIKNSRLPVRRLDLSSQIFVTFEEYAETIREAKIVVTDRLHVALPAAIVGKKVYLVEAGYHKLTGVYNQSLREMPNVVLINAYE